MDLNLNSNDIFYLKVLLIDELKRLDNDDKINVFRGVKMSIYMSLFEHTENLAFFPNQPIFFLKV